MEYVYRVFGVAFLLSIPLWYLPNIIDDMCHPERWNFSNDPRVWLPVLTVEFTTAAVFFCRLLEDERERGRGG